MKALLLIIGAALLVADAAHAACTTVNGKPDISASVMSLPPGFDPTPPARLPQCTTPDPQDAPAIQQAFSIAPPGLQKDLCNLKCIFVMQGAMHSWGKWDDPAFGGSGDAAIAINKSDINKPLTVKMTEHLRGIRTGVYSVTPANMNSGQISLMHTLAHEMAHIKWHRDFTSGDISPGCPVTTFMGKSWSDPGNARTRRWTGFTDEFGTHNQNIPFPSQVLNGRGKLQDIYQRGVATALGANNAEEDFVESYSLATLMPEFTPQISISITITTPPGPPIPVAVNSDRDNPDLKVKFPCIFPLLRN